jgi:hypothetical protein
MKWFGPKEVGVGIRSWKGWAVTGAFLVLLFGVGAMSPAEIGVPGWLKLALIAAIVVGYLGLVFAKYERD